jgi:ectoine hydroxylase-related dioxygenase (phytanoyl-CoA dioxygenase family)
MLQHGYAVHERVFSDQECEALLADLSESTDLSKAGVRNLMRFEAVRRLATDSRLIALTSQLTGTELIPFKATLFNKAGKANWLVAWHQDTALPIDADLTADGWGPSSVKEGVMFSHAPSEVLGRILALRIHLDASASDNGPLRVIPGSHKQRITDEVEFRRIVDAGPQVELIVGRGGVIAMNPLLIHASSKCSRDEPRRVLHIEYAETMAIESGVRLAFA